MSKWDESRKDEFNKVARGEVEQKGKEDEPKPELKPDHAKGPSAPGLGGSGSPMFFRSSHLFCVSICPLSYEFQHSLLDPLPVRKFAFIRQWIDISVSQHDMANDLAGIVVI